MHRALQAAMLMVALAQPIAGFVFVLDGVLIGAGDARYLALAGVANLVIYIPFLAWVSAAGDVAPSGLGWLWAAFAFAYLGARALTLGLRAYGTAWIRI
ncbi:MAG: MATE family efflux transporter, partial [Acidobacteria bacterium]|nr:MATE family efflux transporter [Acidobacteriota bacterium]